MSGAWCPTCRDWSVQETGRPCAWCDTIVISRRGGWKRPDLNGRITEQAARAIHAKYQTGVSARTLGRELHQVLGYKTPATCELAIGVAFRRYGLPVRGRIEATVLASTRDGLSPRDWRERYRRRRAAGLGIHMEPLRPLCKATRRNYPRKGQPCSRPACHGSDYCAAHDPERRAAQLEHVARMRALSPGRRRGKQPEGAGQSAPSP